MAKINGLTTFEFLEIIKCRKLETFVFHFFFSFFRSVRIETFRVHNSHFYTVHFTLYIPIVSCCKNHPFIRFEKPQSDESNMK